MNSTIRLGRVQERVVLTIVLSRVEHVQRRNCGDNQSLEDLGHTELGDVSLGGVLLCGARREDRRAVVRSKYSKLFLWHSLHLSIRGLH
jgi:hypothetical protein